jgi:hypothetical protein
MQTQFICPSSRSPTTMITIMANNEGKLDILVFALE